MRFSILSELEVKVLRQLALTHTNDPYILMNDNKMLDVINDLANAGIKELYDICAKGGDHSYNLIEYCNQYVWKKDK